MVRLRFIRLLVAPALALSTMQCGSGDLVLPGDGDPADIQIIQGDEQIGGAGLQLEDSLVVRVLDADGRGIAGLPVAFVLGDGADGGDVSPDTVLTDSRGESATSWVLGGAAGAQELDASVVGQDLSVRFTASAGSSLPSRLEAVSGDQQTAAVGTALRDSLVVRVVDDFGNPVAGITVGWAASAGDVSPALVETGADGRAAARRILGAVAGTQTATADVPGLEGAPVTFTHTAVPGSAASLVLISGNDQRGPTGDELPDPLVVRLVDESGNGIPERDVSWVVATGGGAVTPNSATDEDGFASATWTLGPSPGRNSLNAVVSGVGVVQFTASATGGGGGGCGGGPGPSASCSTVTANPESIHASSETSTITVTVRDGSGAPVGGATVTLAASGSGNTLVQPAGATGGNGVATGTLRSSVPGTKVVSATVNGSVEINETAEVTVLVAAASRVELLEGDGQTADVGDAVPVRPAVRVTNALGQPVAGFGVTFVVTDGNGQVEGATQSTNSDGVARVGSWRLGAPGTNRLEARATGLDGSPVVFTANGVSGGPDHLVFLVQPGDVVEDTPFSPVVTVAIVDAGGNVVDLDGVSIDIDLFEQNGRESRELEGDTFQETDDGIAAFPGMQVDRDHQNLRLRASSPDLPGLGQVFSNFFDVAND
jgi:adhesin/invasin